MDLSCAYGAVCLQEKEACQYYTSTKKSVYARAYRLPVLVPQDDCSESISKIRHILKKPVLS